MKKRKLEDKIGRGGEKRGTRLSLTDDRVKLRVKNLFTENETSHCRRVVSFAFVVCLQR